MYRDPGLAVTRVEGATKTLDQRVLAMNSFAEAAPGEWVPHGDITIPDFDRKVTLYTPADQAGPLEKPASAIASIG